MRISVAWLRAYVEVPDDLDRLAERLTLAGVEVERIERQQADFEGVLVAEVLGLRPHPGGGSNQLARISTGDGVMEVVTGAPNLTVGDRVPYAPVGARLGQRRMEAKTIRGVVSEGMLCSAIELGLGEDAAGILILDRGTALGADLRTIYPADTILHLEIKSNRPDLLSHLGVAREVAAILDRPLRPPPIPPGVRGTAIPFVTIEAPEGCRRFVGRIVEGITVGAAPAWMQARLRAAGVRPINNVVDVTNYVMLELGQPMHAFDQARLQEGRLIVRRARAGERLLCLDGKTRPLDPEYMVVADAGGPQALAGIIGGAESAVSEATTTIVLEAATWEPRRTRSTARSVGLRTEASARFEKGLSPALSLPAVDRAAALLMELGSGARARAHADVYPDPYTPPRITVSTLRMERVLGITIPEEEAARILRRLDFTVDPGQGALTVVPPATRMDCAIPEDVIEEVGRIAGYERIPSTLPGRRIEVRDIFQGHDPNARLRELLCGLGFDEAVSYPVIDQRVAQAVRLPQSPEQMLRVENPISENRDALRVSLLPGLLEALALNARQDQPGARLFELGTAFWPAGQPGTLPREPALLAIAAHVPEASSTVGELRRLEAALRLGYRRFCGGDLEFRQVEIKGWHPGRTAELWANGQAIGLVGEVHPLVLGQFELPGRVVAAEVITEAFGGRYQPHEVAVPRYPGIRRDLTVVVRGRLPSARLAQVIRELGGYTLREVSMLSEFEGRPLDPGARILSFRLYYQADDRTLRSDEVSRVHDQIVTGLRERFGGQVEA